MKSRLDIKSIVVGALIGAAAFAILGAAPPASGPDIRVGRFQVSAGDNGNGAFIVDTATGEAWSSSGGLSAGFRAPKIK